MAHESFEDENVAQIINEYFVPIKVDREERPDVDAIYMKSCLIMSGGAGWPLNMWIEPDRHLAIYGGTYFPKYTKYNTPGFMQIMDKIQNMWKNEREKVQKSIESMDKMLALNANFPAGDVEEYIATKTYVELEKNYDEYYGGFSKAPKFPSAHQILFLMKFYEKVGEEKALEMALWTLDNMYRGGIYDHIGGGFSRYSVDKKWLIPHFEKMLYDNAMLIFAYTKAYALSGKERYKYVAYGIFDFMINEMRHHEGGFFTAQDADTEGEEGLYYKWKYEEVLDFLGKEDGEYFAKLFDITEHGNFDGGSIPNIIHTTFDHLQDSRIEPIKIKLKERRYHRYKLHIDEKIVTATNGLMIGALAYMSKVMDDVKPLEVAKKTMRFIESNMFNENGGLYLRYINGDVSFDGVLDDYAFLTWAYLELYHADGNIEYLEKAKVLMDKTIELFWDSENGAFFLADVYKYDLIYRPKEIGDGAIPSGNSVAIYNLLRLSSIYKEEEYKKYFNEGVRGSAVILQKSPMHHCHIIESILVNDLEE